MALNRDFPMLEKMNAQASPPRTLPTVGNEIDDLLASLMDYVPDSGPIAIRQDPYDEDDLAKHQASPTVSFGLENSIVVDSGINVSDTLGSYRGANQHTKSEEQTEERTKQQQAGGRSEFDTIMADWDEWFNSDSVMVV